MNNAIAFFCSSTSNGGLEQNLVLLANLFSRQNIQVVFFGLSDAPFRSLLQPEIEYKTIVKHRKYFDFTAALRLGKLFKSKQVHQVIFRHNYDLDVLVWTKKIQIPHLQLIYWQAMQLGVNKKGFYHTFKFNALNYWVATLQSLKEQALQKTAVSPKKLKVIPLPVKPEMFQNTTLSKPEARQLLGLPATEKLMGIVGRIDPKKGQQFVIELLPKIKDFNLLIVGEPTRGEYENHLNLLKESVEKLGLQSRVYFMPFTQKLAQVYACLDVFLMASNAETFGAVTIEAMACGIPVLGTNAGGTPEILQNGELGFLYTPNNAQSFINQFEYMQQNPKIVAQKAALAQQTALKQYSQIAVFEAFKKLL